MQKLSEENWKKGIILCIFKNVFCPQTSIKKRQEYPLYSGWVTDAQECMLHFKCDRTDGVNVWATTQNWNGLINLDLSHSTENNLKVGSRRKL